MKRMTILLPVVVAFLAGVVVGDEAPPAEAQRPAAAPCESQLAKRDAELRRARRMASLTEERARQARDQAEASEREAMARVRELERLLALERERVKRLERALGAPIIEDIDFR